ncbi:MAG: ERAP1-like C-terminal domain-containing protein [Pyrinomonadaceae bacterium]|nr:ERAP1-like C-terminal domain-containing protein [Pyrinomonadaceae bacterium]
MMTIRACFILLVFTLMCNVIQAADPGLGVPRELARMRAERYSNVHYALTIRLAPGADLLKGEETIRVTLDEAVNELVLDWRKMAVKEGQPASRAWDVVANKRKVSDAREANDHLIIPGSYLVKGENTISLKFESPISTSGSAVTRYLDREDKSEYIYTLFVPSDASTVFPCFDQPDLKARFQLKVSAPREWKVITNTAPLPTGFPDGFVPSDDAGELGIAQNVSSHFFPETQPISTYLFAFAAGPFVEINEKDTLPVQNSSPPLRIFVRKSKAERARKELPEVFRLTREGVKFFDRYFDYKFPFPKYDQVIVPEFAYGGMEHAGATFLREESILFPSDPTANDLINRAEVVFHELAHQWFGDLVTMRWFDDLWLKEGFATFMAYKAMEAIIPEYNAWKVFYQKTKPLAYQTDVTKGTTPIWQEISNLSAAKSAYGNIVYRKAPSMLRQAEFYLEPEKFQRAVQLFLKEHAYRNAEWADLVRAFERTSARQLSEWAAAWVKRRGMPDVRVDWSVDNRKRINSFTLRQTDVLSEGGAWPMKVKLLLAYDDAPPETLTVILSGTGETRVKEVLGKRAPRYVFANYEDYGYGRFLLDKESEQSVIARLGTVTDPFLRALLWGTLWDSVREAEIAPLDYIELAIKLLPQERDEVTAQSILSRASTSFNRYLSNEEMRRVATRLEQLLSERMINADTPGLRITYFRAFQSVATSAEAREQLKKILRGEIKIPGMTLRSRDRFDIVTALLMRGDADAPALLEKLSREDTTDDARRYAYAAGAARGTAATKKSYFDAYLTDAKLAESWIEASLAPFNSIQQSELTLPYLERALAELPTLKRTRKIFFVNGWLASFLGGQCNERALTSVRSFLERNPSLDRDLRLKVLETADGLERCVRIRAKYAR